MGKNKYSADVAASARDMKISTELPPNYEAIKKVFPAEEHQAIFTYGDTIYNPWDQEISADLVAHESEHFHQQTEVDMTPEIWWDMYLTMPAFRFQQEAMAYAVQFKYLCKVNKDRNVRVRILHNLGLICASALYGNMAKHSEAMAMIKHYAGQ